MTTASTHVRFAKRIAPAPYEHEELEVNFAVEPGQNLESELFKHKALIYKTLKATVTMVAPTTSQTETKSSQGEDNGKKISAKEKSNQESSQKESGEKSSKEEVKTEAAPAAPKKEKATKAEKVDGIPYDSENKDHKSTLSNFLTKLTGSKDWAADKVKSASISKEKLHGQLFITKDGTVLPSFEALCKEQFAFAMKGGDDVL